MQATSRRNMKRADIAQQIYREVGLSRADAAGMVEQIIEHLRNALTNGENVKISGFGSFVVRAKAERIGRNPRTGEEVPIAPRKVVTFRPSRAIRARVAHGVGKRDQIE
jgi:integration host factor subunit alpha